MNETSTANETGAARLFEPIPRDGLHYQVEVAPIQRLMVRVDPAGNLFIRGQRAEIDALLERLRQQNVAFDVCYISFCG